MKSLLCAILLALSGAASAAAQGVAAPAPPKAAAPAPEPPGPLPVPRPKAASTAAINKIVLPKPFTVPATRDLLEITATTEVDDVTWSVFFAGGRPVKFVADGKTLYLPVPDPGVTILISAFVAPGAVAQTSVTVSDGKQTPPGPGPGKTAEAPGERFAPGKLTPKLFVTLVYDKANVSAEQAAVLNSGKMRSAIEATGGGIKIVTSIDPFLEAKKLAQAVAEAGLPCLVIQDASGAVRHKQPLPATEAEALALISKLS